MTSARALEKLHKVNYYVPHVHFMRIRGGDVPGQTSRRRGVSFGGLSSPLFLIPETTSREMVKNHEIHSLFSSGRSVRSPMKIREHRR